MFRNAGVGKNLSRGKRVIAELIGLGGMLLTSTETWKEIFVSQRANWCVI
jgi:hypothetical protein